MKSALLFLAATAAVVTCKPQRNNNDIIWFPVDGEDGIYVSLYGEKRRTDSTSRFKGHRRARSSGNLPFQPYEYSVENEDPSFFHSIWERKSFPPNSGFVSSVEQQQFSNNPFLGNNRRPQRQNYQNLEGGEIHEIINEVFGGNNQPPVVGDFEGRRPFVQQPNRWDGGFNSKTSNSEWFLRPNGFNQQNGYPNPQKRPQVHNNNGRSRKNRPNKNRPAQNRPGFGNQNRPGFENQIGPGQNRPVFENQNRPIIDQTTRPTSKSDKLVFPEDVTTKNPVRQTTTPFTGLPTEAPTLSPCERTCPVTPEFNPVCGSDSVTYTNAGRLKCAKMCGKDVVVSHFGNCGRPRFTTPLVSDNPRKRRRENRRPL